MDYYKIVVDDKLINIKKSLYIGEYSNNKYEGDGILLSKYDKLNKTG